MTPDELRSRYREYLDICNRHELDMLTGYLAERIRVNETSRTRSEYVDDLAALFESFPDYRWILVRDVVEEHWIAVHLRDSGTRAGPFRGAPGDGALVTTDEFAIYHFTEQGLIEHVETTADNARLTS